jgi:hypothetical protein
MGNGCISKGEQTSPEVAAFIPFENLNRTADILTKYHHFKNIFSHYVHDGYWVDELLGVLRKPHAYNIDQNLLVPKNAQMGSDKSTSSNSTDSDKSTRVKLNLATMLSSLSESDLMILLIFCAYRNFIHSPVLNYWLLNDNSTAEGAVDDTLSVAKEKSEIRSSSLMTLLNEEENDDDEDEDEPQRRPCLSQSHPLSVAPESPIVPLHALTSTYLTGSSSTLTVLHAMTQQEANSPGKTTSTSNHVSPHSPSHQQSSHIIKDGIEEVVSNPNRVSIYPKTSLQQVKNSLHNVFANQLKHMDQLEWFRWFHSTSDRRSSTHRSIWSQLLFHALNSLPVGIVITALHEPVKKSFHSFGRPRNSTLSSSPSSLNSSASSPSLVAPMFEHQVLFVNKTWENMLHMEASQVVGIDYLQCLKKLASSDTIGEDISTSSLQTAMLSQHPTIGSLFPSSEDALISTTNKNLLFLYKPVKTQSTSSHDPIHRPKYAHLLSMKMHSHAIL